MLAGVQDARAVFGASLFLSPPAGSQTVGSTFTVSLLLNTNGNAINAVQADLSFPPDKLQVVSPSLGYSIISVWTNQPHFDNVAGTLSFQGGIPNPGITTDRGVIATITFRVRSIGDALVRFLDTSKVLLNDGRATDVLTNKGDAIYSLTLPPPRGPVVVSETNPDQSRWYPSASAVLRWTNTFPVDGYSYVLNDQPIDIPDDTSEGQQNFVIYKGLSDGIHFFHVKALRSGVWGPATDFALNIDTAPPADFPIEISPSDSTSNRHPVINFLTTDAASGLDHYEIKIVPLGVPDGAVSGSSDNRKQFFSEASSPYAVTLDLGAYDVIVRAYDKAGNFREVTQRLTINTPILQILSLGFLPRWLATLIGLVLLAALLYFARRVWIWHREIHLQHLLGAMQDPQIAEKLKQLQNKRSQYLRHLVILLAVALSFGIAGSRAARAEEQTPPPVITTIAKDISNEEAFYIGGKAIAPGGTVVIYLENTKDGETLSATADVDKKGDWFYSFPTFLNPGQYLVWTQLKIGQETSAPSGQQQIYVSQTAIQLGASRLSFDTLYLIFIGILLAALAGLLGFIGYHGYHGRAKQKRLLKEVREAEEAVKAGFLLLHRDMQAELSALKKKKAREPFTKDDETRERQLMQDLDWVNQYIEKEVRDIDRLLGA